MSDLQTSTTPQDAAASPSSPGKRIVIFGMNLRLGALLAWGALIVLLIVLALGLLNTQQGPVGEGQHVPTFTLTTFDGQQYNLVDLKGKVVVVNFWASWCKPCEQEAADMQAAWQYYEARGDVIFLGVDYVDTEPQALSYLEKFQITYPNGPDLRTRISQAFRIRGVPETYFIDSKGQLAFKQIGPFSSLTEIKTVIDPLLSP